ncbi:GntR family transcriptional regulator [Clostridiaceae bacterium HSG29]|nr:GntR family transcriptional regulator [Clostridiaceae bacterium HSG29]
MKFNNTVPIYIQIMNAIIEKIVSKELKKGEQLQSVREFAVELKVNVNTVRNAYGELETKGIIFKKRGIGTFVTEDMDIIEKLKEDLSLSVVNEFIKKMEALGYTKDEILKRIEAI